MVIAEIRASNGALVRIHDDCMAPRGSEEERRRIEAQRRAAHKILTDYAKRQEMEAKSNGKHGTHRRSETQEAY